MTIRSTRRVVAVVAAALFLLGACGRDNGNGGDGEAGEGPAEEPSASETGPSTGETDVTGPGTTPTSASPTSGAAGRSGDGAERVVVLVPALLDAALAVGVDPVAAPGFDGEFASHLGGQVDGVQLIDVSGGPNLEELTALRPDLIITQAGDDNSSDQLARIAETVEIEFPKPASAWSHYVADVAGALGRTNELAAVAAEHEARVAAAAEQLAPALDGREVSILRFRDGIVRQYGPDSFAGSILVEAGIRHHVPPAGAEYNDEGYADVSVERLGEVAGDVVVVFQVGTEVEEALADDPLWNALPAVQDGDAHFVEQSRWLHIGYQSAAEVLADTVTLLTADGAGGS